MKPSGTKNGSKSSGSRKTSSASSDQGPLVPKVVRQDSYLTAFTAEENYVLLLGMEIKARVSPSSTGGWRVAWPKNFKMFPTREAAIAWLEANKDDIARPPIYRTGVDEPERPNDRPKAPEAPSAAKEAAKTRAG